CRRPRPPAGRGRAHRARSVPPRGRRRPPLAPRRPPPAPAPPGRPQPGRRARSRGRHAPRPRRRTAGRRAASGCRWWLPPPPPRGRRPAGRRWRPPPRPGSAARASCSVTGMPQPRRVRLVVLFGGQSAEHDVSCVTAKHVLAAVDPARYSLTPVGITREGQWVQAEEPRAAIEKGASALPEALTAEGTVVEPQAAIVPASEDETVVVFPLLHGPMGEDGTVQGLLELAGVPYVGTGVLGSALAMDKAKAKETPAFAGIPQARWQSFWSAELEELPLDRIEAELGLPCFVKPANLGSSGGVSKAHDRDELQAALELALSYDEWVLVEEAIAGREIELAVLGNADPRVSVPGEVVP